MESRVTIHGAASRLSMLEGHICLFNQSTSKAGKLKPQDDVWASIDGDSYLSQRAIVIRSKTREFMSSIEPQLTEYINKCEFPFELVPKIKELGFNGFNIKDFGGPGLTTVEVGAMLFELAKVDASIFTFITVHNSIGMAVVDMLGSEEQRKRFLTEGIALKKVMSFGLTEPDFGSDASSLKTSARKVDGGYVINGQKRWIGNATWCDYIIVWARNENEDGKIQAFVVEKGSKGLTTQKIENKYALRMVQNADITLENVFVPDNNRLAKATDFATSTNLVLELSRIKVCWGACGVAAGAYEAALRFVLKRKQFGRPVASFQLSQLKLSKMLAMVESMLVMTIHVGNLSDQGKTTIGQIGRTKAHCTQTAREVCQMARDICGGDGILLQNRVMKQLMDMEALHTYEGTYEVNMLVSGREITGGLNAIKK